MRSSDFQADDGDELGVKKTITPLRQTVKFPESDFIPPEVR